MRSRRAWYPYRVMNSMLRSAGLVAGLCILFAAMIPPPQTSGQTSYIPRPPEPDTILGGKPFSDPRIAPRDAWNPFSKDPRVPRNDDRVWNARDWYNISHDGFSTYILPVVENGHLGPKTNPRGFWREFKRARWVNAVAELKYVLNVFPNHPRALYLITRMAELLHDPGLPIAYFEKALRMYPNRPQTRTAYGAYLVKKGEPIMGLLQLDKALEMNPELLEAIAWRAEARRRLGLRDESDTLSVPAIDPGAIDPRNPYQFPTSR